MPIAVAKGVFLVPHASNQQHALFLVDVLPARQFCHHHLVDRQLRLEVEEIQCLVVRELRILKSMPDKLPSVDVNNLRYSCH